jgi:Fe-S-cluster containining protein
MYLGDYIVIEEQSGPFEYLCSSVSTGTPFITRIDEDKRILFEDHTWIDRYPAACPFLRPKGNRRVCTIHEMSPLQCKAYRCVVFRILAQDGRQVGTITGTLNLHTEDPDLRQIWEGHEWMISHAEPETEEQIGRLFESRGYRVL